MQNQDKCSQQKTILEMLRNGRISRKAFFYKGISCPTGRITELRKAGHDIVCHELPRVNGKRATEYELVQS